MGNEESSFIYQDGKSGTGVILTSAQRLSVGTITYHIHAHMKVHGIMIHYIVTLKKDIVCFSLSTAFPVLSCLSYNHAGNLSK